MSPFWERQLDALWRIRYRLLLVHVLIVAVPLLGILFARFHEREMLRTVEADMNHQAQLVRGMLLADPAGLRLAERAPALRDAGRENATRILLLDGAGAVVADSRALVQRPGPPPTLAARPEVKQALAGGHAAATRLFTRHDRVQLYVAHPIVRAGRVEGVVYVSRSTDVVRAAMHRLRERLYQVLFVSLLATTVLSLFLAATISRPLARLTRIAQRMAGGDRSVPLALDRRDEIGQLARAFDAVTRKLDERARDMGRLAADISHEFKSPLTGIRGAAELLLEGAADDPPARARFLENILADAHRLDRLVTRLLELSRLESDPTPAEVFDYEALVREVAARSRGPAPLETRYLARTTQLLGRRAQLAAALGNLVDNAQQHAAPGTPIAICVHESSGRLRTTVHNVGPVIAEANLRRIWDRFFTTRGEHGGSGLGLPIVATVATAHGGAVEARSSTEEGTIFTIELPLHSPCSPPVRSL